MLDIKDRDFKRWPGRLIQDRPPKASQVHNRIQVWVPELHAAEAMEEWQFNIKNQAVRQRQAAVILYDELAALIYKREAFSEEYRRIQKVGGGLGLTTMSLTQELGGIPPTATGQCQHFLCWRVQKPYDLIVAESLLGFKPRFGPQYSFWYKNQDNDAPAYEYADISDFL